MTHTKHRKRRERADAEAVRDYINIETRPLGAYTPPEGYVIKPGMRLLQLDAGTALFFAPHQVSSEP